MQDIAPHDRWRSLYKAEEDERSPFYGYIYNTVYYENDVYGYYLHPYWNTIGSPTLFVKLLFTDYSGGYAIIELIGEWNDEISNDIMFLKREVLDVLISEGIHSFILLGHNIMQAFIHEDGYYEEWWEECEEGFIAYIGLREHVQHEFKRAGIGQYLHWGGDIEAINWRILSPVQVYDSVRNIIEHRLS